MTADKQQPQRGTANGNLGPADAKPVSGANCTERSSQVAHLSAGLEEPEHRLPMCRALQPANGKLAGFGGPASEIQSPCAPIPIWFAALLATCCQVRTKGNHRAIRWNCVSGRAVYTNQGAEEEVIEPLGVRLQGGHTVAVCWIAGETSYTVEIFRQFDCCA